MVKLICRVCGNYFRGRLDAQYCSGRCRHQARRRQHDPEPGQREQISQLHEQLTNARDAANAARTDLVKSTEVLVDVTRKMRDLQKDMIDDFDDD